MKNIKSNRQGARRETVSVDALRIDEIWADLKKSEEALRHAIAQYAVAAYDLYSVIAKARDRRDKRKRRSRR